MSSESPKPPTAEPEIAEVGVIARAEAERRKKGLIKLFAGLAITALVLGGMVLLGQQGYLGPTMEVEEEEKENLDETNDPQCRAMIDDVTTFGEQFKKQNAKKIEPVLSEDPEKVKAARAALGELREELEGLRIKSEAANLRYDNSRKELRDFFKFVDTELRLVDLRGEYQLQKLEAEAKGETWEEPSPKSRGKIIGKKKKERANRSPEQKRDDAIIAVYDAFNTFRVWHTASAHPCGAADEGETPWVPKDEPAPAAKAVTPAQ